MKQLSVHFKTVKTVRDRDRKTKENAPRQRTFKTHSSQSCVVETVLRWHQGSWVSWHLFNSSTAKQSKQCLLLTVVLGQQHQKIYGNVASGVHTLQSEQCAWLSSCGEKGEVLWSDRWSYAHIKLGCLKIQRQIREIIRVRNRSRPYHTPLRASKVYTVVV